MGVMRGSVVRYLIVVHGSLVRAALDSLGIFRGSVLGQDTSESQPGETQEGHE